MYTAAPAKPPPPEAMSSTVRLSVIGTPGARVVLVPKLVVISERSTPLCSRMSGPLLPSPGYGPLVSSGISVSPPEPVAVGLVEDAVPAVQPATASPNAPTPARPKTRRRLNRVPMSNCNP